MSLADRCRRFRLCQTRSSCPASENTQVEGLKNVVRTTCSGKCAFDRAIEADMVWDMRGAIPKRSAADARNINALKLQMFTGEGMFICLAARLKRTIFHEILKIEFQSWLPALPASA